MRLFAFAVRESLEGTTSPDRVEQVIMTALERAGLPDIPEDLELFRRFVSGALTSTLTSMLGPEATESCVERLGHVLWMASSTVRSVEPTPQSLTTSLSRRGPTPAPTPPGPPRAAPPRVARAGEDTPTLSPPAPTARSVPVAPINAARRLDPPSVSGRPYAPPPPPVRRPSDSTRGMDPPSVSGRSVESPSSRSMDPPSSSGRPMDPPSSSAGRRAPTLGRMAPVQVRSASVMEFNAAPGRARGPVLVLTLDPSLVTDVGDKLTGRRDVVKVPSRADFVRILPSVRADGFCVLVDTTLPSIELPVFAGLASLLPEGTRVVLWGADARQKQRLVATFPQAKDWIPSGESGIADLFLI
jgi:hypothetical protein